MGEQLLDEEWVPFCALDDRVVGGPEFGRQPPRVLVGEGRERDALGGCEERRMLLEQLLTREREDSHGAVTSRHQMLDRLEDELIAPMHVVELRAVVVLRNPVLRRIARRGVGARVS